MPGEVGTRDIEESRSYIAAEVVCLKSSLVAGAEKVN